MTDLPVWLQEIRERADKATKGPWTACGAESCDCGNVYKEFGGGNALALIATRGDWDAENDVRLSSEEIIANKRFIAHARTDVPRLIGLVGEMAGALDSVVCVFDAMNDVELSLHVGMEAARVHLAARQVLAKFRGEVENECT